MPASQPRVNVAALYAALEAEKDARRMSWRQLARECELSPSTLTRLAQHHRPDVDAFAALVRWLGQPAEVFMTAPDRDDPDPAPDLVATLAPLLRARKDLTEQDAEHLQAMFKAAVEDFLANRVRG